jgi:pyruvate dehydrogenase E2 component (dihydrolipoamide acetyltransferase)
MRHTVLAPNLGDYADVPVIELLVKPGDVMRRDAPLLTLESDKAAMEVPSPVEGRVIELLVALGVRVSEGTPLAVVELVGLETAPTPTPASATPPVPAPQAATPVAPVSTAPAGPGPAAPAPVALQSTDGATAYATPSVRAFARELGVPLEHVRASGPKGRILREDVAAYVKALATEGPRRAQSASDELPWPSVDFAAFGPIRRTPLTRVQKLAGANLARNWRVIPHVTNFDRADVTDIEEFRKRVNEEGGGPKLTMVAFLVKAAAAALRAHPRFNASLDGADLIEKDYVHIGVAVDTPAGLIVPVIRDCDRKGLREIAEELARLAARARDGKLTATEMQGGCFTVSSLGGVGGDGFTPIINAPEVAILGAGRARIEPVWDGAAFAPRLIQPISLSWDHRVVDGVAAARFLGHVAATLADFRRAIL